MNNNGNNMNGSFIPQDDMNNGMNPMNNGMNNMNGNFMPQDNMNNAMNPMNNGMNNNMNGSFMPQDNMNNAMNPMNNGMNNMNGNYMPQNGMNPMMNNNMNQNNMDYNDMNYNNYQNNEGKKFSFDSILKNKKLLKIGGIAIGVILVIIIISKLGGGLSSHKNTTGISGYSGSDISYNCSYSENNNQILADIAFNHKNYQAVIYYKYIVNGDSDEKLTKVIEEANALECMTMGGKVDSKCLTNHLDLGITSYGYDTIIDRKGGQIIITAASYNGSMSYNDKISSSEKEALIEQFKNQGFDCK